MPKKGGKNKNVRPRSAITAARTMESIGRDSPEITSRGASSESSRHDDRMSSLKSSSDSWISDDSAIFDANNENHFRGRRDRSSRVNRNPDDETDLFREITNGRNSPTEIVDNWTEKYIADRETATLILFQLIIDSCGAKFCITPEILATMNFTEIVCRMTEEDSDDNFDYPLTASGRWKDFGKIYNQFLTTLVRRSQKLIFTDDNFPENLLQLLIKLSHSHVRAFRHTATYVAMKLMLAFVDIAAAIARDRANINRQHDTEKRKSRESRSTERLEILEERRREIDDNAEQIDALLDWLLAEIFAPRCLDVSSEIRVLCIVDFAHCALKYPNRFLDNRYFCNLNNRLYDEEAEVRLKCLEALRPLYESEKSVPYLVDFTRTIKNRVIAMTCEKDYAVAKHAVRLLNSIGNLHEDILEEEDCEHIYKLVYSANRGVACAAGEFVNERLFRPEVTNATTSNTSILRDIVTFFVESEFPDHAAFLVDALIETNEALKDWKSITDLLLDEAEPGDETLDDEHETRLVEILHCCVKQSSTGEGPARREASRKNNSVKWHQRIQEDKRNLTEHLIGALPPLLERYTADSEKIIQLIALPRYFDLEIYTTSRQEPNLEELLRLMSEAVEQSHHPGILANAAKSFETMCNEELAIFHQCDIARSLTLDRVYNQYREANESYMSSSALTDESGTSKDNEILNVLESLRKLVIFCTIHDMSSYEIWNTLWKSLEDARFDKGSLPDEAVVYCTQACYSTLIRNQINLIKLEDSSLRAINAANLLTERLHSFMDLMMHFVGGDANVSAASIAQIVREEAYDSICDMLVYFNKTLLMYPNPVVHQLIYTADNGMQKALNRFVQENVFGDSPTDECSIEEYNKRRKFIGGICKLLKCGTISLISAADVFKHYVEYYDKYGDIMKDAIGMLRDRNRTSCALVLLRSLEILYAETKDKEIDDTEDLAKPRILAKRFVLLFGMDVSKNADAFVALHQSGFAFASASSDNDEIDPSKPPKNLSFLEVLVEFSAKLVDADKVKLLKFVEETFPEALSTAGDDEWSSLHLYRSSLTPGGAAHGATRKKGTGARRKIVNTEGDEGTDQSGKTSIQEPAAKPKKKRVPRKTPLPVSKIMRPAVGLGTTSSVDSHTSLTPDLSQATIEDSVQADDSQTDGELFQSLKE